MDLARFWVIVVFIVCCEQSGIANNVNALDHPGRSRPKKSIDAEIYLALPPDNVKTGKQDGPPTLIRLNSNAANKLKGKFPTPIERFIQRIQNYFSVYNPPEYLNDLQRPGINNPEYDGDQTDYTNETQIVLPCNGTSTIVIIPVPLESENVAGGFQQYTNVPDKPDVYGAQPSSPKPSNCPGDATTPNTNCPEVTAPSPKPTPPCAEETTVSPQPPKCPEAATTTRPKCPEATTTTTRPKCPEATTTTTRPKCPEATTPKAKCPETTTAKAKCPEATTPKPECPEAETQKSPYPAKHSTSYPKPISGYGSSEVPPLNLVAQPVLGSTVVYFYKQPSTTPPTTNPPSYYAPSTPTPYDEYAGRPKPPMLRLKQLLFPRLYAAFHSDK